LFQCSPLLNIGRGGNALFGHLLPSSFFPRYFAALPPRSQKSLEHWNRPPISKDLVAAHNEINQALTAFHGAQLRLFFEENVKLFLGTFYLFLEQNRDFWNKLSYGIK
jgi:hypothetical protein